jgi:predicted PurR-regulated permease PerM
MNQERIVQVFFFGFLALMTWQLYQVFEPFLMPLAWAILLAFLFHPALIELDRRIYSRSTSALIITIIVALGVVLPAVWLSERLVNEGQTLYGTVSDLSTKGSLDRVGTWLRETSLGARLDGTPWFQARGRNQARRYAIGEDHQRLSAGAWQFCRE